MIMQGRAPLRLTRVGLLSLALMAAATLPGWAAASQDPPPPPKPVPVVKPAPPVPPVPVLPVKVDVVRQDPPAPPKPVRVVVLPPAQNLVVRVSESRTNLPAEGTELVDGFDADRDAIQREADRQVEARRQALVKALEDLQDQYTKAGKLDEAIAVRDYLRAGLPGLGMKYVLKRQGGSVRQP